MRHFLVIFVVLQMAAQVHAQELVRGITHTAYLPAKSSRTPFIKLSDGSLVTVSYREPEGFKVVLTKNAKTMVLAEEVRAAQAAQLAETDVNGDGRNELIIAFRTSGSEIAVTILHKPEYETYLQTWTELTCSGPVEFAGKNLVHVYTPQGQINSYRLDEKGQLMLVTDK